MKRFIALVVLSLTLAIGTTACAHKQLTDRQVAKAVLGSAAIITVVALLVVAFVTPCDRDCNIDPPQAPQ